MTQNAMGDKFKDQFHEDPVGKISNMTPDMNNSSTLHNGSATTNYGNLMGRGTGFMGMSGGLADMGMGIMRARGATMGSIYPGRGLDEYSFRVGLMDRPIHKSKTYLSADQMEEIKHQTLL